MPVSFFLRTKAAHQLRVTLICIYLVRGLDFMKVELYSGAIAHTVMLMFIRLCVWNECDRSNLMASGGKCIVMLAFYLGKTCTEAFYQICQERSFSSLHRSHTWDRALTDLVSFQHRKKTWIFVKHVQVTITTDVSKQILHSMSMPMLDLCLH